MLSLFLTSFYLISSGISYDHAIYISVLEIDDQRLHVKVFTDNLEDAIRNDANSIEGYFQKRIRLQINEQNIPFSLDEVVEEGDSYWISFRVETPGHWHSFYLEADYFMELFPDQINVVKVLYEKTQFFRLTKLNPSCSFNL